MSLLARYLVTAMPSSASRNLVTVMSFELRNFVTTLSRNLVTEMSLSSRNWVSESFAVELLFMNLVTVVSFACWSRNLVTVTSLERWSRNFVTEMSPLSSSRNLVTVTSLER